MGRCWLVLLVCLFGCTIPESSVDQVVGTKQRFISYQSKHPFDNHQLRNLVGAGLSWDVKHRAILQLVQKNFTPGMTLERFSNLCFLPEWPVGPTNILRYSAIGGWIPVQIKNGQSSLQIVLASTPASTNESPSLFLRVGADVQPAQFLNLAKSKQASSIIVYEAVPHEISPSNYFLTNAWGMDATTRGSF